ncbi:hypothetical protein [Haloarchaeobius sp. FL176]|uniref:hypothetical protein n=1 Tax=Haloarchaeobius sp. FL176 TaxID=2967129 RepID=UPI002147B428|nr:hypothetical protein [Haloarchaeobius sp. FL176]
MSRHRRRFLRLAAGGMVGGLAGCSSLLTDGEDGVDPQAAQFKGAVVAQQSADAPARTEIRVVNTGGTEFGVKRANLGARPFEFVSELSGAYGETMLLPGQSPDVDVRRGEKRRADGCWRVVDGDGEAYVAFIAMAPAVHVPAGGTYVARHQVYYHGPADRCLPAGEYRKEVAVEVGRPRGDQDLESDSSERGVACTLRVGQDGELSLSLA